MPALLVLFSVYAFVGQGPSIPDQFAAANRTGKVQLVSDVVLGRRDATDAEVRALLAAAMIDPDSAVRANAVGSITTILTMTAMRPVPAGQEWTVRLRSVAESLKPQLDAAANDPEPRVRTEALRGLLVDVVAAQPGGRGSGVPTEFAKRLAAQFESDPSPVVRGFILQALTMSGRSDDPEVQDVARTVLLKGAASTEPAIVQAAAISVSRAPVPEALPLMARQLAHPSAAVRISVAQAIAAFHEAARPYLPQLTAAANAETDDIARKTIAGAIAVIGR